MDNQHQKIRGYRDLSQEEIDLMNEIKEHGERLRLLCDKVKAYHDKQIDGSLDLKYTFKDSSAYDRLMGTNSVSWYRRGRQTLQEGIMFLVRSVAQPTTF